MNINELFTTEGQSIHTFKKGDIIIRVKRGTKKVKQVSENLGVTIETEVENTYSPFREAPGEFIGICNNLIYIKRLEQFIKGTIAKLPIEDYSEHWALFVVPDGLTLEDCI